MPPASGRCLGCGVGTQVVLSLTEPSHQPPRFLMQNVLLAGHAPWIMLESLGLVCIKFALL